MNTYHLSFFEDLPEMYVIHEWSADGAGSWSGHSVSFGTYEAAELYVMSHIEKYGCDGRFGLYEQTEAVTVIQLADTVVFTITQVNVMATVERTTV